MFSGASYVDFCASGKEVVSVKLPAVSSEEIADEENHENHVGGKVHVKDSAYASLLNHQIPNLVTLSLLPKSQWQNLINLDIIKVRNKPIEPPKKPEKAPFFLPSVPSFSGDILFKPTGTAVEEKEKKDDEIESSKRKPDLQTSQFLQLLLSSAEMKNFSPFTDYIKGLSPSTLDLELRMLQIIDDEDQQEPEKRSELYSIELLLDYFIHEISCRKDYEFIQAVIRLFLKLLCHTKSEQSSAAFLLYKKSTYFLASGSSFDT
ncbi:U3 small nucleolar RNA-associated protein 21 homolog isoform X2 [Telopea speciosissima]|uniref:U3 small nucleolar RNA-associated protein 21 homolog isoform X2 n=1 Tax=Telopea speciosissima TaxID=54955 RepID=UPI001CC6C173|nr:U3 small nucleolar RNA-associated protein 21 homolog isoform X2 [Telopea speciosissima]